MAFSNTVSNNNICTIHENEVLFYEGRLKNLYNSHYRIIEKNTVFCKKKLVVTVYLRGHVFRITVALFQVHTDLKPQHPD